MISIDRISVVTDEVDDDLAVAIPELADMGIRHAELRVVDAARVPDISENALRQIVAAASTGVRFGSLSPGILKGPVRGAGLEYELDVVLPATLRLARHLGIERVISFGGARDARTADARSALVRAAAIAGEAGVELVLENSSQCRVATSQDLRAMHDATGLRVVWDPGNAAAAGQTDLGRGAEGLADLVASVHVRDWNVDGWQRLGRGVIDWAEQLRVLAAHEVAGYFCVESHRPADRGATRANVQALLALLALLTSAGS